MLMLLTSDAVSYLLPISPVCIDTVFKLLFRFILTGDGERMLKIGPLYPNIKKITFQDNNADVLSATKAVSHSRGPDLEPYPTSIPVLRQRLAKKSINRPGVPAIRLF